MALKHRVVQRFERKQRSVDTIHEIVRSAFNEWLERHRAHVPPQLGGALQDIGGGHAATYQRVTADGQGEALRWRFITGSAPHIYRSTITVLVAETADEPSWIWYDVETDRESSHFHPPRLTPLLTKALDAGPRDRVSGFTEGLRMVRSDEVGEFLDIVLNDERRQVPAFVSGGRNWSLQEEEHVERALEPLHGIGTFWQLAPDAFDEFNELVRPGYAVYSGSIHSFQFGLDTEDDQDARRHWWFSPSEVHQSMPKDLSQRLHAEAMQSGLQVPLPEQLSGLGRLFDQLETRRLFGQFQVARASRVAEVAGAPSVRPLPKPPTVRLQPVLDKVVAPLPELDEVRDAVPAADVKATETPRVTQVEAAAPEKLEHDDELGQLVASMAEELALPIPESGGLLHRVKTLFLGVQERLFSETSAAVDDDSIAQIQSQYEDLLRDRAALQGEVGELTGLLGLADEEAEVQSDILESQRAIAAAESRRAEHLASELAKLQRKQGGSVEWEAPVHAVQENDPVSLSAPTSVDDLFAQILQLKHVVFSGDRKLADRITDLKLRGIILRDVWRFSCELERYVRQKSKADGAGNLREYVEKHTTQITPNEFAADETKALKERSKFSKPRMLPVPVSIDPSGKVFMGAHFRLSQDNGKAMRMHVHDATQVDGKIYIGYIGQHLPSRKTS